MGLMITEDDIKEFPETIEFPEEKRVNVVVEGRQPTYYGCGQKSTLKTSPPFFLQEEETIKDVSECYEHNNELETEENEKQENEVSTKEREK